MDQVDTLHVGRYWSQVFLQDHHGLPWVTLRSRSQTYKFCVKILVKVFISQYLLNMFTDQVDTLHVDRYWSQVVCCTIMTHLDDLEVKVTDLEILC